MKLTALSAFVLSLGCAAYGQVMLRSGQSWTYTFPSNAAFPQIESLPFFFGPPQLRMSFAVDPSLFESNSQLRFEIIAGGKYTDQMGDWWITPVASAVVTSVPPVTATLNYSGLAWLDTFSPGGIRFTALTGSVLITNVVLEAWIPHPGPGGTGATSHRRLAFVPQPAPMLHAVRSGANQVRITWPTNAFEYSLEQTANLPQANPWLWTVVTNAGQVVGAEFSIDLDLTDPPVFFRLRKR
jgi:hypothetical protein